MTQNRKISGVIFDKDGTLLDFNATWVPFARMIALGAANSDEAKADELLDVIGYDHASKTVRPDSHLAAGTITDIASLLFPNLIASELARKIDELNQSSEQYGAKHSIPLPGVIDALKSLHQQGITLALGTNDSERGGENAMQSFGVRDIMSACYGYNSVINAKPAPDMILKFCRQTGLASDKIAMVGDNSHDLHAARSANVGLSIGVLSGTGTRQVLEPLADVILNSVRDLPNFLLEYERTHN